MISGRDLIQLANRWSALTFETGGNEAVWRTSIGRSYYGAFHVSRDFLSKLGIANTSDGRSEHQFIQRALQHSSNAEIMEAGTLLVSLHEYRKKADYDLSSAQNGTQRLAIQCVEIAGKVCSLIDQCDTAQFSEIKLNVLQWQRRIRG